MEKKEKTFDPSLWKPLEIKPIELKEVYNPGQKHSFPFGYGYQKPSERYEVRGIMPKAPKQSD